MRVLLLITVFVIVFTNGFAQRRVPGEKGVSSVGVIVGYGIETEKAVAGIDYRYNILDKVRLAPSVLYNVKRNEADILYVNADVHYLARITPKITLYPLGGLGVFVWRNWVPELVGFTVKKQTESDLRIGLNLGFGGEMRITKDFILGAEFRYNWTKQFYNQAMLLARFAYYF